MRQSMGAQSGSRPRSRGGRPSKGPRHQVVGRVPLPTVDEVDRAVIADGAQCRSDWIGAAVKIALRHPGEMRAALDVLYGRSGAQLRLPTQLATDDPLPASLFSVHNGRIVVNPRAVVAALDGNLTDEAFTALLRLSLELVLPGREVLEHSDPVGGPGPLTRVLGRVPLPTLEEVDGAVIADGALCRSDWTGAAVKVALRHPGEMRAALDVLYGRITTEDHLPAAALFSVHDGRIVVDPRAVAAVLDGSLTTEAFINLLRLNLQLIRFDGIDFTEQEVLDRRSA